MIYLMKTKLRHLLLIMFFVATSCNTPCDPAESEMVWVKGGTFILGSTYEHARDYYGDNWVEPTKQVAINDYYIGKYEITQTQWIEIMNSNPSHFKGDGLPVTNVSWDEVQVFITRLNERTGKHYRLPAEYEWEYAAKGGNKSKKYKYSGSNKVEDVAWYSDNSKGKVHPVGTKLPNELGIYDMSGNVMEWCNDWCTDPAIYYSGCTKRRIIRGGGWDSAAWNVRVSHGNSYTTDYSNNRIGFRLARSSK